MTEYRRTNEIKAGGYKTQRLLFQLHSAMAMDSDNILETGEYSLLYYHIDDAMIQRHKRHYEAFRECKSEPTIRCLSRLYSKDLNTAAIAGDHEKFLILEHAAFDTGGIRIGFRG